MPKTRKQGQGAPRRSLPLFMSQNFLTSSVTIHNILKRTTLTKKDHVLEIGPGKGHITRALLRRCGRVTAVELDGGLFRALEKRFAGESNLRLVCNDFLKYRLPESESYKVFANIPFNHTTAIVNKLTACRNPPEEMWLVVEKGAAKRFLGLPRENLRSLLLKPLYDLDIAYYIQREDFHPKPDVDAVLLHIKKKAEPDIPFRRYKAYMNFIEAGLRCSGHGLNQLLTPKQITAVLKEAGLQHDVPPAHLLYVQWLCLFRRWG